MPAPLQPNSAPAAAPQQAGAAAPRKPPMGNAQATAPTQNRGHQVAGIKMLGMALLALERAVPLLGSSSDEGRVALDMLHKGSKLVPPGAVTPADVKNVLQQLMQQQQQFGQQMNQMQQRGAKPGAAQASPAAAAGGGAPGAAAQPGAGGAPMAQAA